MASAAKLGIWSLIASAEVLDLLVKRDPEVIFFDLEHGSWTVENVGPFVSMCGRQGIETVVRLGAPNPLLIQKAFDLGPSLIQVSGLRSRADLETSLASMLPPPEGHRGYSPWTRSGSPSDEDQRNPALVLQVESLEFLQVLETQDPSVLQGCGGLFAGRYDLSVGLGVRGQISAEPVIRLLERISELSARLGVAALTVASANEDALEIGALGYSRIGVSSDRALLGMGL